MKLSNILKKKFMRKYLILAVLVFTFGYSNNVIAQEREEQSIEVAEIVPGKNLIKVNLTSLALKNVSLQYERAIAKKISFGMGVRFMPEGTLPLMSIVKDISKSDDPDDDMSDQLKNFRIGNFALTPEVRFYMGKEALRGFYIAPFARYATFNVSLPIDLETEDANNHVTTERIDLKGDLSTIAGGILFGAQWKLSKIIYLDWHILGPHFGKATGNLTGKKNLTPEEQTDLRELIEDFEDIPFVKFKSNVNENGASIKVDGPWAGIRAGITLGFRF
jgi:hypothetical protein